MSLDIDPLAGRTETIAVSDLPRIDLAPVRMRVAQERSELTLEQLDELEHKYLRFLMICKSEPKAKLQPDKDVDQYWHAHILHTRKYAEDCERYFGYFLHHVPNDANGCYCNDDCSDVRD